MSEGQRFGLELEQQEGFEFRARFDWPQVAELVLDEPAPLGKGRGPQGRYRIPGIDVVLSLSEKLGDMPHQERCLEQFEDFCIVMQSIRAGIPVNVTVVDAQGKVARALA